MFVDGLLIVWSYQLLLFGLVVLLDLVHRLSCLPLLSVVIVVDYSPYHRLSHHVSLSTQHTQLCHLQKKHQNHPQLSEQQQQQQLLLLPLLLLMLLLSMVAPIRNRCHPSINVNYRKAVSRLLRKLERKYLHPLYPTTVWNPSSLWYNNCKFSAFFIDNPPQKIRHNPYTLPFLFPKITFFFYVSPFLISYTQSFFSFFMFLPVTAPSSSSGGVSLCFIYIFCVCRILTKKFKVRPNRNQPIAVFRRSSWYWMPWASIHVKIGKVPGVGTKNRCWIVVWIWNESNRRGLRYETFDVWHSVKVCRSTYSTVILLVVVTLLTVEQTAITQQQQQQRQHAQQAWMIFEKLYKELVWKTMTTTMIMKVKTIR